MKVKICFTIENLNAEVWAAEHLLDTSEVRKNVQSWAKAQVLEELSNRRALIK